MLIRLSMLLCAALFITGCGSITRGTSEPVQITSEPASAEISTSIGHKRKSPCTITVDRKTSFTAYAEHPGYHRGSVEIGTKVSGKGAAGFAGNVVAGGLIGMAVDSATGAALDHHPNPAKIVLVPIGAKTEKPSPRSPKKPAPRKSKPKGKPIS